MHKVKYLILGAGPTGLSFAHALRDLGEESFLVIEEKPVAGGLCRSEQVDGSPLDTGGGHFLDVKRPEVLEMLFRFLPEAEWQRFERITKIRIRGTELDYPLEANLWQLPIDAQLEYLESIAQAGCVQGKPMPESFEQWITWKLGERIADEYMLPYNRKIWSIDLNDLGTYWLHKLPDVSFKDTLRSCLESQACGSVPAHGVFLYPRQYGYGEVWRRMGEALHNQLLLSTPVTAVDAARRTVNNQFCADILINTIPWTVWPHLCALPNTIAEAVKKLEYSSIDVDYQNSSPASDAHWIYEPDPDIAYHRLLCRSNFCAGSRGFWTETNSKRSADRSVWRWRNDHAYPLNTRAKPAAIATILQWARANEIVGLGRWGTWEHMNSDVAVEQAIAAARLLVGER